jgi:sarcosine oxidase
MRSYDVIVLGLGAMGSATAYQLARRGIRVLGIDQFRPPHSWGSTHGESRVTRQAIGEGDQYVGLVRRSHELWREIEAATGTDLLTTNGCLVLGLAGQGAALHGIPDFLSETVRVARAHGIEHEILDDAAIRERFPQFSLEAEHTAYFEPGGGFVRPERAVAAQLDLAQRLGAALHLDEKVEAWSATDSGATIRSSAAAYHGDTLIVTAGPWTTGLLGRAAGPLTVSRQVNYWFRPADKTAEMFTPGRFPAFIWPHGPSAADMLYGVPMLGPDGVKVGSEDLNDSGLPVDDVRRDVSAEEQERMAVRHVRPRLPALDGACVRASVCLYTETPDRRFIIDRHPDWPQIIFASPCSGHGFKHSAAIGEALAQLAVDRTSTADLSPFSLDRFEIPRA